MALSHRSSFQANHGFIHSGIILLLLGMTFGLVGGLQYVFEGLFKSWLSFDQVRPLHVTSVVFWIIMGATGSVLSYIPQHTGRQIFSPWLARIQFILFSLSVIAILISYLFGIFGGREYWEFHPVLASPIILAWILFLVNILKSIGTLRHQPVYIWMWVTGGVFFLYTYVESYLWLIPWFRSNIVHDMTIQWKSYGSMVGSWNMLIYGCSMFLMSRISGNKEMTRTPMAFALYFTGLTNLMFNWGHHIYTLPTFPVIKHISYIISMTELFILGRIIWTWRSGVSDARRHFHFTSYRFMLAADIWVLLTLLLAIVMSIPAINVYTHGTHVTVAHTMGATIGINTFLLLAIALDILRGEQHASGSPGKWFNAGYILVNLSLFVFWISLIVAGVLKAGWQMNDAGIPFSSMMRSLRPVFIVFVVAGAALTGGIWMILHTGFRQQTPHKI